MSNLWISLSLLPIGLLIGILDTVINGGKLAFIAVLNLLGLSPVETIATMQIVAFPQTLTATVGFARKKLITWKQTLSLAITATIGALVGANLTLNIKESSLAFISGMIMFIMLSLITEIKDKNKFAFTLKYFTRLWNKLTQKKQKIGHGWKTFVTLHLAMLAVSFYGGFFGAGIGVLLLLVLLRLGDADLIVTAANAKLIDVFLSLTAGLVFLLRGQIIAWQFALPLIVGSSLGSFISVDWVNKIKIEYLKIGLYLIVIISAIKMLLST